MPGMACFRVRGSHPLWRPFPEASANISANRVVDGPSTPADALRHRRFGLLRVRSPLLAQSLLFSFPPGTEMFQFPGFAPHIVRWHGRPCRVAPFGNPRISEYLPLHAAYRSLSRPSSPPRAKASFMCPSLLSFFLKRKVAFLPLVFQLNSPKTAMVSYKCRPCVSASPPVGGGRRFPRNGRVACGALTLDACVCSILLFLLVFDCELSYLRLSGCP